jgi:serine/threonine protein kinase
MNNPDYDSSKTKSSTSDLSSPDRSPIKRLSIKDFDLLKQLGKGSFAEVYLARNSSNTLLAIKILDKHFMQKVHTINISKTNHMKRLLRNKYFSNSIIRI